MSAGQDAEADFVELCVRLRRYVASRAKSSDKARVAEGKTLLAPLLNELANLRRIVIPKQVARPTRSPGPAPSGFRGLPAPPLGAHERGVPSADTPRPGWPSSGPAPGGEVARLRGVDGGMPFASGSAPLPRGRRELPPASSADCLLHRPVHIAVEHQIELLDHIHALARGLRLHARRALDHQARRRSSELGLGRPTSGPHKSYPVARLLRGARRCALSCTGALWSRAPKSYSGTTAIRRGSGRRRRARCACRDGADELRPGKPGHA